jgi:hypothetical protein
VEENRWRLRLKSEGIDAETQQLFSRLMTEGWSDETRRVELDWEDSPATELFKFILETIPGGRPYVLRSDHTIHLYPLFTSDTFQHELGHVLGFQDNYFTVWSDASCSYREEYNSADIMSNSSTGRVLESHWQALDTAYPLSR